ncbi:MAG: HAD family hydrolase [Bacteroidales bacterium]|nr:HAD family hydrolase [Bacteroidales bacterium]
MIKAIGFDADDTLWENQIFYDRVSNDFYEMMVPFLPKEECEKELFKTEMQNMEIYGYGARAFILSIMETALRVGENKVESFVFQKLISHCKNLVNMPIILREGVTELLDYLTKKNVQVVLITKGDLLDQQRKIARSGVKNYFHRVEILSNKKQSDYQRLFEQMNIESDEFLMIGNSLKSDILPVTDRGGWGIYVPHDHTWAHEHAELPDDHAHLWQVASLKEVPALIESNQDLF